MRNIFIQKLVEKASKNKKIVLVVGDLGFGIVEPFKKKFPERFFNVGVAEHPDILQTIEDELEKIAHYQDKLEALREFIGD